MKIYKIICDICGYEGVYPKEISLHNHPELEIGGVPLNIWTSYYSLPKKSILNIKEKNQGILKYLEYLPEIKNIHSCGEGNTPLIDVSYFFGKKVLLKDEGTNPSGSFKDRGIPMLLADMQQSGKSIVAIPSTGNTAVSLVKYAKEIGVDTMVFVPKTTSIEKIMKLGKNVVFDDDLIASYEHFYRYCNSHPEIYNGFPAANIPYSHGIKTIAYELFNQLGGKIPDYIILPCGSGVNVISQFMGFNDILNMGLSKTLPKIIPVQIKGADPITHGFHKKMFDSVPIIEPFTDSKAEAIASDTCFNYFKIINMLKITKSTPISVTDKEIEKVMKKKTLPELEFSSCSVYSALEKIIEEIPQDKTIILIGTAAPEYSRL